MQLTLKLLILQGVHGFEISIFTRKSALGLHEWLSTVDSTFNAIELRKLCYGYTGLPCISPLINHQMKVVNTGPEYTPGLDFIIIFAEYGFHHSLEMIWWFEASLYQAQGSATDARLVHHLLFMTHSVRSYIVYALFLLSGHVRSQSYLFCQTFSCMRFVFSWHLTRRVEGRKEYLHKYSAYWNLHCIGPLIIDQVWSTLWPIPNHYEYNRRQLNAIF